ncbi:MAG: hypothetical protein VKO21_02720 [Candidatus Sericytochromatia bacterium]|nr:hypothetical protein [Candidatus Sericytochromatia bacterium]
MSAFRNIIAGVGAALGCGCAGPVQSLPTETVSFRTQVAPVFERSCTPCHNAGGSQAREAVYLSVTGQAEFSRIRAGMALALREIESGHMPPAGHVPVSKDEQLLLRAWVAQGSLDN